MADNFDQCLECVLQFEGGYVDDPLDNGGATNKGITQVVYDTFRQEKGLIQTSVKNISDEEVSEIYKDKYWAAIHGESLPPATASVMFDSAVNSGTHQATKWIQRVVGTEDDGIFGTGTFKAINKFLETHSDAELASLIIDHRVNFIDKIIEHNPSQMKFRKGWMNRLAKLKEGIVNV